jgi:hypothetical protein
MSDRTRSRAVPGWLAGAGAAAVLFLLPFPEWLIERAYSRGFFPVWQRGITSVSNLAPFAVLDLLIVLIAVMTLVRLIRLIRGVSGLGVWATFWESFRRFTRAIAMLALIFLGMWGLNYRRVPLERTVAPARPSVQDLEIALTEITALAASQRARARTERAPQRVATALRIPFDRALAQLGRPALGTPGRPKHSRLLTPFFTAAGVDGMIDPFALETIVHPDLLPFEQPFVLAHEWAHLAGTGDEAEASAVGWLACMNGDAELAYSGHLYGVMEIAGALPRRVWLDARARLDPGILEDLRAVAERQRRQRPQVQHAAFRAYDSYLRANRVEDGIASYSRALSFILALRSRAPGFPAS